MYIINLNPEIFYIYPIKFIYIYKQINKFKFNAQTIRDKNLQKSEAEKGYLLFIKLKETKKSNEIKSVLYLIPKISFMNFFFQISKLFFGQR